MKKVKLFRLSHWSERDENAIDCEIACDCVKRANVVLYYVKIFSLGSTQPPMATSQHLLSPSYSDHDDTHVWFIAP